MYDRHSASTSHLHASEPTNYAISYVHLKALKWWNCSSTLSFTIQFQLYSDVVLYWQGHQDKYLIPRPAGSIFKIRRPANKWLIAISFQGAGQGVVEGEFESLRLHLDRKFSHLITRKEFSVRHISIVPLCSSVRLAHCGSAWWRSRGYVKMDKSDKRQRKA